VIKDAASWIAILREATDVLPAWVGRDNTNVILNATVALIDQMCRDYRQEQAENELRATKPWRVGQLEKEEPLGLKDKGCRFQVAPEAPDPTDARNLIGDKAIYLTPSRREPLWNPPTKRYRGHHLSREEIEALGYTLADDNEDDDGGEDVAHVDDSALNDGSDDGFDDAEDFDAEGYEGFEDKATEDGDGD
jgi:hypothetical protein